MSILEEGGMTAVNTVRLVNPVGSRALERATLARRLDTLDRQIDRLHRQHQAERGTIPQYIEEMMRADYRVCETHTVRKNFTSSKLIADKLDGKVDAVVNAWGD